MNRSGGDASIADVYAADTASHDSDHKDNSRTYIFAVESDAEPDVLGRVANLFVLPMSHLVKRSSVLARMAVWTYM
jgi:hypothetical protein